MKKTIKNLASYAAVLALVALPSLASAITPPPKSPVRSVDDLEKAADKIFNLSFWLLTVVAIFFVLFAAYKYLTASGDPEKMKEANKQILYAAIAVAVALIAKGVPAFVQNVLS